MHHMNNRRINALAKRHRSSGFTMIELLIAVALTAMLLSMAVPALDQFTNNARQTSAINDFVASMQIARSTAVTTNFRTTVCASSNGVDCESVGWDEGWIVFGDRDADQNVDNDETVVAASNGMEGVEIISAEFGDFLMYRPNGRVMTASALGNAGQFTVCDNRGSDRAKVLIVDLSGRPRLSKVMADGSAPSCP
jgi:type IV fimbrial biogenesis protein FimT